MQTVGRRLMEKINTDSPLSIGVATGELKSALQLDPTNDLVKENIKVAEQKLKEEQERPSQTSDGELGQQSEIGTGDHFAAPPSSRFPSMNFTIQTTADAVNSDLARMFEYDAELRNANLDPTKSFEYRRSDTGARDDHKW